MIEKVLLVKKVKVWLGIGALVGLSLFLARDFFRPGLPVSHDSVSHPARLASFVESFSEGNLVPRWGAGLNAGYGHPVLMFLYPLTNYLGTIFYLLGFSLVNSVKLVFLSGYLLAGIGFYFWLKALLPKATDQEALLGALLYQLVPYRGVDFFIRGALGEQTAFAVAPLVGLGLARLIKTGSRTWFVLTAISYALLILAHNALALLFSAVFLGLLLVQVCQDAPNRFRSLALAATSLVLGMGLAAFFWLPAFLEGKYTLRDIVTGTRMLRTRFPNPRQWLALPWQGRDDPDFTPALGPINLILIFFGFLTLVLRRRLDRLGWLLGWLVLVTLASLFLLLPISLPAWEKITILPKFQFPWRLLAVPTLTVPLMAVLSGHRLKQRWVNFGLWLMVVFSLGLALPLFRAPGVKDYSDGYFFSGYLGTTDTGESSPRWSVRGLEKRSPRPVEVVVGQAQVTLGTRTTTKHSFQVETKAPARIKDNTLYFPGWQVLVDGQPAVIEFQDPNHRGMITFDVPAGRHQVLVKFGETRLRLAADLISLFSLVGTVIFVLTAGSGLGPRLLRRGRS